MNKNIIITLILSVVLAFQITTLRTDKVEADNRVTHSGELRGIWISTTKNLDYPSKGTTSAVQLRAEADNILDNCRDMGMNAIFLQVRDSSNAIYKSSIYPWSEYLTGSQGTAPSDDFDPLEYWIKGAHSRGMELHAWINPYRVTNFGNGTPLSALANTNPAKQHPEYCIKHTNGNYYFDPAIPEVRQLVLDGVDELVKNYDIDGIHLDDYFYPSADFDDSASYAKYGGGMDKAQWRRNNVNLLISGIRKVIDDNNSDISYGISPSGIWANKTQSELGSDTSGKSSYYELSADTRKWALDETIDYIAPQIYWEIGHKSADYKTLVDWWADTLKDSKTKLYIGLADYKAVGISDAKSVWYNAKAIKQSMDYNNGVPKVTGEIHFRYGSVMSNDNIVNIIKAEYGTAPADATVTTQAQRLDETTVTKESTTEATTSAPITQFDINSVVNTSRVKILVYIDGERLNFDQEPVIINSRAMIPLRAVFEKIGADVSWNDKTQQIIAKTQDREVSVTVGNNIMLIDRKDTVKLDAAPVIRNGRTLLPVRAISEAFGLDVVWNDPNRVIAIYSK